MSTAIGRDPDRTFVLPAPGSHPLNRNAQRARPKHELVLAETLASAEADRQALIAELAGLD
jgi:hypothetical protein